MFCDIFNTWIYFKYNVVTGKVRKWVCTSLSLSLSFCDEMVEKYHHNDLSSHFTWLVTFVLVKIIYLKLYEKKGICARGERSWLYLRNYSPTISFHFLFHSTPKMKVEQKSIHIYLITDRNNDSETRSRNKKMEILFLIPKMYTKYNSLLTWTSSTKSVFASKIYSQSGKHFLCVYSTSSIIPIYVRTICIGFLVTNF